MKALPTQFDDARLTSAVATPTCSSCCCCCCCVATVISSSITPTQRVHRGGRENSVRYRRLLTVLAVVIPLAYIECLHRRVGLRWSALRSVVIWLVIAVAVIVEFFVALVLIITGLGVILYPLVIILVSIAVPRLFRERVALEALDAMRSRSTTLDP